MRRKKNIANRFPYLKIQLEPHSILTSNHEIALSKRCDYAHHRVPHCAYIAYTHINPHCAGGDLERDRRNCQAEGTTRPCRPGGVCVCMCKCAYRGLEPIVDREFMLITSRGHRSDIWTDIVKYLQRFTCRQSYPDICVSIYISLHTLQKELQASHADKVSKLTAEHTDKVFAQGWG